MKRFGDARLRREVGGSFMGGDQDGKRIAGGRLRYKRKVSIVKGSQKQVLRNISARTNQRIDAFKNLLGLERTEKMKEFML